MFYIFESAKRDLWIHDRKIAVGDANVVLVEDAGGHRGRPQVVRMLRIDPNFTLDKRAFTVEPGGPTPSLPGLVQAKLESVPEVRAFIR
jgi:hypothetical protein